MYYFRQMILYLDLILIKIRLKLQMKELKLKLKFLIITKKILKVLFNPNLKLIKANIQNQELQESNQVQVIEELTRFKKLLMKMLFLIFTQKTLNKLVKVKHSKGVYQKKMKFLNLIYQILNQLVNHNSLEENDDYYIFMGTK